MKNQNNIKNNLPENIRQAIDLVSAIILRVKNNRNLQKSSSYLMQEKLQEA